MDNTVSRRAALLSTAGLLAAARPAVATEPRRGASRRDAGLVAADSARFTAMVTHDTDALERLLADELVYVHSSSTRQSKLEHVADIRAGRATYARIEPLEQVPSVYGDTGLVQGVATFTTGPVERQGAFMLRYTSVYVWRQARWQMVAFACSRIPGGPRPSNAPGSGRMPIGGSRSA
jgi:hypothetical protein